MSSRAVVRKSISGAQERQLSLVAEARRAWAAMSAGARSSFTFVYSEKTGFRPGIGQSWGTALGAFTAWYVAIRLCGRTPGVPSTPLATWAYDGGAILPLFAPNLDLELGLYASGLDPLLTPLSVWAVAVGVDNMPPARPVWTRIYSAADDPPAAVVTVPGYGAAWDLTPYLVARGAGRFKSPETIFKGYISGSNLAVGYCDRMQVPAA